MLSFGEGQRLRATLGERAAPPRILVLGDIMLDRYLYGEAERISPEAPVPVVRVRRQRQVAGGAANVALNLARLGAETIVSGYVGDDAHGRELLTAMLAEGMEPVLTSPGPQFPTITKTRVVGSRQQMLRIDHEEVDAVPASAEAELLAQVKGVMDRGLDAVVLSDYAKGVLSDAVCDEVIRLARAKNIPVFVDPKGIDYRKYTQATCLSPNRKELAAAVHLGEGDLESLISAGETLRTDLQLDFLLATLGELGMALLEPGRVRRYATQAREVFDVSGAGDTVIATLAFMAAIGLPMEQSVRMANLAAGFVVAKLGTYAISMDELLGVLDSLDDAQVDDVLDEEGLRLAIETWTKSGKDVGLYLSSFDPIQLSEIRAAKAKLGQGRLVGLAVGDIADARVAMAINELDAVAHLAQDVAERIIEAYGQTLEGKQS
ncbi:MAG: D-glycero-beta-D-manno-heptose-7-phosphate kinase [Armatimonadetes bacterium]|nr:D-glycero-beta-D-manno-heptose-7-phosphate kinase [Armatimonadota bacterium]